MIFERPTYLKQLIDGQNNRLIKIITGIRRCGKSFLLNEIFYKHLISQGVSKDHIIQIAFDDWDSRQYCNPEVLMDYIKSMISDDGMYYLLFDEVQLLNDFVPVMNGLLRKTNLDIYVTGSNSRFLSSDIATEFRGRGDIIRMYPLSFSEIYTATERDKETCLREYFRYGGLPHIQLLKDAQKKAEYLQLLADTVYISDVVERNNVRNKDEIDELLRIIASIIGSPCNPTKLSNTFKSIKHLDLSHKTISKYISYLEESFLIEKALSYNVKGKKYINTLSKLYFTDLGLRNVLTGFRQIEEGHIMENVIYNELLIKGFSVDVGIVDQRLREPNGTMARKQFEVDFVANNYSDRFYIQSALYIPDEQKMLQETASLRNINDSFKKIVIVKENIIPWTNNDGIYFMGIFDFLLNPLS